MALAAGTRLGQYEVRERIGRIESSHGHSLKEAPSDNLPCATSYQQDKIHPVIRLIN